MVDQSWWMRKDAPSDGGDEGLRCTVSFIVDHQHMDGVVVFYGTPRLP